MVPTAKIRVNLCLPVFRVGGVTIDPVEQAVGRSVEDLLRARMAGSKREEARGKKWAMVYPLEFREGDEVSLPLGGLGEFGFRGEGGLLRVTVPAQVGAEIAERLKAHLVRGPENGRSASGTGAVQRLWVRPQKGLVIKQSIGSFGEISVEIP